jgi:hypothetical protein
MNFLLIAITLVGFAAGDGAPAPDLSGSWKQDNEHCSPKRSGDVTLKIQQSNSELVVETTSKGLIARHALQRYTTDGVESASTGADGDEFHSKVVRKDATLVFDILEIEDGKRLKSSEIWSLTDGGSNLMRVRRTEKSGDQVLLYVRMR